MKLLQIHHNAGENNKERTSVVSKILAIMQKLHRDLSAFIESEDYAKAVRTLLMTVFKEQAQ